MMHVEAKYFKDKEWPLLAAMLIQDNINAILREQDHCSVMLTGGRSAERLYTAWAELPDFRQLTGVSFYFGDERCVPPDHRDSNFGMAMRTLFHHGVTAGCSVSHMEASDPDCEGAALRYERELPHKVDVMLLGVGEDGHIASLFPGCEALREASRKVVPVVCPKPPHHRLTITPPVIALAKSILVLASGSAKSSVLLKALQTPSNVDALPARLVLNATWLLDTALPESIFQ